MSKMSQTGSYEPTVNNGAGSISNRVVLSTRTCTNIEITDMFCISIKKHHYIYYVVKKRREKIKGKTNQKKKN